MTTGRYASETPMTFVTLRDTALVTILVLPLQRECACLQDTVLIHRDLLAAFLAMSTLFDAAERRFGCGGEAGVL